MKQEEAEIHPSYVATCLTESRAKKFYMLKCDHCGATNKVRADHINNELYICRGCVTKKVAYLKAQEVLKLGEKYCNVCGVLKSLDSFGVKSSTLDGRRADCKCCRSKNTKEKATQSKYQSSYAGRAISTLARVRRRTAMNASADGSINARSLQELMNKQNKCCYYCDTPLDFDTIRAIHLDHVIPLSKQGPHIISNVVWSCQTCNISKGVK